MTAGITDEDWEKKRSARVKSGDKMFSKWEKLATLADSLSLVAEACMRTVGQSGQTE